MEVVGLGGSTPQFNQSGRPVPVQPLFHSYREQALIIDKTVLPGFGALPMGTVMAKVGQHIAPYTPVTISADDVSRAFVAADITTAAVAVVPDAYALRFEVGQEVIAADTDGATDGGAITDIDPDYAPGLTAVTFTNNVTITVAKSGNIYHKAGTTGNFSDAAYILDQVVNTGMAEYPVPAGANTSVVVSNAVLYASACIGLDSAAQTSLGVVVDGKFAILK